MKKKMVRSRAPLRIGLAGGGTDVSPYCDEFGGYVLNTTINLFAHCVVRRLPDSNSIKFIAHDIKKEKVIDLTSTVEYDGVLDLHAAVYNRIVKDFNDGKPIPCEVATWSDAPPGSGLGSSSTMVVALIAGFAELMNLPLGEYDMAQLAYEIERVDLGLSGGKQDQYAATFGGFNFMEFNGNGRVLVNPLKVKPWIVSEMEMSCLLVYTGRSRDSSEIIEDQKKHSLVGKKNDALESMHLVKDYTMTMKELLLKGEISEFAKIIHTLWEAKKRTATKISNPVIDKLYNYCLDSGASSGKISGAGGGGFMVLFVAPEKKFSLIKKLEAYEDLELRVIPFNFTDTGVDSWIVKEERVLR